MHKIPAGQKLFLARLAIGLAQGVLLYLLYRAQDTKTWPATDGELFAPLLLIGLYVPILLSLALGEIAWRAALLWALAAIAILAALGFYDIWSAWPLDWGYGLHPGAQPHILPSPQLFLFGGAGLFIAHALVIGGQTDQRFMARYPTYFDIAWKLAVQVALTIVFVGAFWLLLWLGAGLFNLIKLDFFRKLLRHEWFSIPAVTLAAAGALHLTDIRPVLVRGARTLLLTLLSWLLPLIALIVAGFLASLPFTGLAPLWSFGHASGLLLTAAAVLIILINAAHQDGDTERAPVSLLRWSGTLAALLPVPLVVIAAYALLLRVQQYGWTVERVIVAATVIVAFGYALGYAAAAIARGPWLKRIEAWNFYVALLILGVLVALFTPIASPVRIAVADQVARLNSGKTAPEKFDFKYLRWHGGRYGRDALTALTQSRTASVRDNAAAVLQQTNQFGPLTLSPKAFAARITVYPAGLTLPPDFAATTSAGRFSDCLTSPNLRCDAIVADFDGDSRLDVMLFSENDTSAQLFRQTAGAWRLEGTVAIPYRCRGILKALREGRYQFAPPARPWRDIEIAGAHLHVRETGISATPACPK